MVGTTSSVCSRGLEAIHFAGDDGFRAFGFLAAVGNMRGDGLLQVVNVIDEDAVELVHGRVDVARYGDIDKEHGPVLATAQEQLAMFAAEDRVRRAGGGDHDVGAVTGVVQIFEMDGLSFELVRQADGAFVGAIGHEDRGAPCASRWRAASSLIFPAPTRKTCLPCRLPKIFLARSTATDATETDDDPTAVSVRTRLATAKARVSKLIKLGPDRPYCPSRGIRFLHLTENLRLAHDHRVQAGGHAKHVAHGFLLVILVQVLIEV